jgi:hypothetical protein
VNDAIHGLVAAGIFLVVVVAGDFVAHWNKFWGTR